MVRLLKTRIVGEWMHFYRSTVLESHIEILAMYHLPHITRFYDCDLEHAELIAWWFFENIDGAKMGF